MRGVLAEKHAIPCPAGFVEVFSPQIRFVVLLAKDETSEISPQKTFRQQTTWPARFPTSRSTADKRARESVAETQRVFFGQLRQQKVVRPTIGRRRGFQVRVEQASEHVVHFGNSSQVRPLSDRPAAFLFFPPTCLKKNGIFACTH